MLKQTLFPAIASLLLSFPVAATEITEGYITPEQIPAYLAEKQEQYDRVALTLDGKPAVPDSIQIAEEGIAWFLPDALLLVSGSFTEDSSDPQALIYIPGQLEGNEFNATSAPFENNTPKIEQHGDDYILSATLTTEEGDTKEVTLRFNESAISAGTSNIRVEGETAFLNGTLGFLTYRQLQSALQDNPNLKEIVLGHIDGSVDDTINVHTGRLIRNAGLTTRLTSDSEIASGGVDLFVSGAQRIVPVGAQVGVHSWCCVDGKTAQDLSEDDPAHRSQLEYFNEMLGDKGRAFYFFTLKAAAFDDIHWMSPEEIKTYGISTN